FTKELIHFAEMATPAEVALMMAATADEVAAARALMREYADALTVDLSFQDFETELAELPGEYVPPAGRLLLARDGDAAAGCVALRPLPEPGVCEMKRLYARPSERGRGVGRALIDRVI